MLATAGRAAEVGQWAAGSRRRSAVLGAGPGQTGCAKQCYDSLK